MTNKALALAAPFAIGIASLGLAAPFPALACNPEGCGTMSKEDLEADAAEIRRLNNEQLRYVEKRDAEYAKGWAARREHKAAVAEYERRMAAWRDAVKRCEAGDTRYCAPR